MDDVAGANCGEIPHRLGQVQSGRAGARRARRNQPQTPTEEQPEEAQSKATVVLSDRAALLGSSVADGAGGCCDQTISVTVCSSRS